MTTTIAGIAGAAWILGSLPFGIVVGRALAKADRLERRRRCDIAEVVTATVNDVEAARR